jgi:uncharacterized protein YktB (UPF0637 family)
VEDGCVVELRERVDEQFPVRSNFRSVLVDLGHLVKRVAHESRREVAEVLGQWQGVLVVEVDEDEAFPHIAMHGRKTVVRFVEVEEL